MAKLNTMNQDTSNFDQDSDLERFPIRVLAEKTSVGTSTLRAWERRYGLLHPEGTPKGHRLYSDSDAFQASGGVLSGSNVSVALKVFESHVPAYSTTQDTSSRNIPKRDQEQS